MSKPGVKSAAVEGEINQNQPHPKQHLNYAHHSLHDITPDACTRESSVTSQATLKLTSRESWCMAGETCAVAPPSAEPESTKHSSTSATCNTHFITSPKYVQESVKCNHTSNHQTGAVNTHGFKRKFSCPIQTFSFIYSN